ncbi:hypothetical protein GCM10027085_07080 [Spirosoma aerophilum]
MAPQPILEADIYQLIHTGQPALENKKVYVTDLGDSLQVIIPARDERRLITRSTYQSWTFKRSEADVDVFTLPFKVRPAQGALPAQLNSNFNAALYLGRRVDLYNYRWQAVTPSFGVRQLRSRGFGYGVFAGIGSVALNDFVVRLPIGIEYEGVVLDAGAAAIYDARIFNIGLAVGFDYLTDKNRTQWIYQQKPWFGVLFGLNLN